MKFCFQQSKATASGLLYSFSFHLSLAVFIKPKCCLLKALSIFTDQVFVIWHRSFPNLSLINQKVFVCVRVTVCAIIRKHLRASVSLLFITRSSASPLVCFLLCLPGVTAMLSDFGCFPRIWAWKSLHWCIIDLPS